MNQNEPIILTDTLPEGYRIILDDQDLRYYPQRQSGTHGGIRFATRTDLGGGHIDKPLSFPSFGQASRLIAHHAEHPCEASWGSIIYSLAELSVLLGSGT